MLPVISSLNKIARDENVAIVATNQMKMKVTDDDTGKKRESKIVPALNEAWAHAVGSRLILSSPMNTHSNGSAAAAAAFRTCTLSKSPIKPVSHADFMLEQSGIRDVCGSGGSGGAPQHQQQYHIGLSLTKAKRPKHHW